MEGAMKGAMKGAMSAVELTVIEVDAFVGDGLRGNGAGVCLLEAPLSEAAMQAIAAEVNLPETTYVFRERFDQGGHRRIRWFTPTTEVRLCGHATLASAFVLGCAGETTPFVFDSLSGPLAVSGQGDQWTLDFPAQALAPADIPELIRTALGDCQPLECWKAQVAEGNWLLRLADEDAVRALQPDLAALARLAEGGVMVTAPGREVDFVSRFFAPNYGVDEDPVTGSAHCALAPYWAGQLGRDSLSARQLSARGGELHCQLRGERVLISGRARLSRERRFRVEGDTVSALETVV